MKKILLFIIFSPSLLCAQIDVDEYRQRVVDYSYTLKKASAEVEYANHIYGVKRSGSYPSLTLSGEFSELLRNIEGQESWNFALQPQISQTVYGGGSVRAEKQSAALGVEVAELDAEYDLLEVCYTADYNFYNLVAMSSFRDAVARYVEIITSLKEVVELRYEEGYIAKGDLLMIETRLSEALYEQISFNEDYMIALQKFNILMGCDTDQPAVQKPVNIEGVKMPVRASLDDLLLNRPDLLAQKAIEQQAEQSVNIARAAYNPTLSVGVSGLWRPSTPNINGSTTMDGSLFVKLSASIFHFGERRRAVAAAQSLQNSSAISTLSLIDDIRLEESNMWATIVDSHAQLEAARRALDIGSENLEISTFAYSEGLTTILDVMQAQISWLQLYTNSIWSEFNYLISISAYRRITAGLK
ncbi:MAG: TolC family protein [Rikenellaceae bacterium]